MGNGIKIRGGDKETGGGGVTSLKLIDFNDYSIYKSNFWNFLLFFLASTVKSNRFYSKLFRPKLKKNLVLVKLIRV